MNRDTKIAGWVIVFGMCAPFFFALLHTISVPTAVIATIPLALLLSEILALWGK